MKGCPSTSIPAETMVSWRVRPVVSQSKISGVVVRARARAVRPGWLIIGVTIW